MSGPADLVVAMRRARFMGRTFPCTVGRGGVTGGKREGDGATPRGSHRIVGLLYRPDRLSAPAPWAVPIRPGDLWSDDPASPDYNQMIRGPARESHEVLRRADPLYDVVLVTDWNWPDARPGSGSAIFLHRWRGPGHPTAGCIAFRPDHLAWIAQRAVPGTGLIVR